MKSLLGSQQFAKCNFCLGWDDVTQSLVSSQANLHMCGGCFDKCRKSRLFRVVKPKTLEVFEVRLRKCLMGEVEITNTSSLELLLEAVDNLESEQNSDCEDLKRLLGEFMNVENAVLSQLDPIRDLVNRVYGAEFTRIERLWEKSLEQVDSIAQDLNSFRKKVLADLATLPLVLPEQSSLATLQKSLNQKLVQLDINRLKELARDSPQEFFKEGFKLSHFQDLSLHCLQEKSSVPSFNDPSQSDLFTQRINNPTNNPASQYFLTLGSRKQNTQKRSRGPFCSGEKENNAPHPTERSVSPFQPLRSPRDSASKFRTLVSKGSRKDTQSVDSCTNSENEARQQKKAQIRDLLKNKPNLPSYKPLKEKAQLCKQQLYAQVVMKETIYEAIEKTFVSPSVIELIAYNTQYLQFQCYLEMLSWHTDLELVRLVKVNLTDDHLNILLPYLRKSEKLEALVLTNNLLTDSCLDILVNYFSTERPIRSIYLGRNYIQLMKCRTKLSELRALNVNVFI